MNTNDVQISEHFYLHEFECSCCKRVIINRKLLDKLEELREKVGSSIIVTSGYRCSEYNRVIKGHPFSLHTQGRAVDIASNSHRIREFLDSLFPSWYFNENKHYFHLQLDEAKEW